MNYSDKNFLLPDINAYCSTPGNFIKLTPDKDRWPEWLQRFINEAKVHLPEILTLKGVTVLRFSSPGKVKVRFNTLFWIKSEYNFEHDLNTVTLPINAFDVGYVHGTYSRCQTFGSYLDDLIEKYFPPDDSEFDDGSFDDDEPEHDWLDHYDELMLIC